jgi:hypothetical protein
LVIEARVRRRQEKILAICESMMIPWSGELERSGTRGRMRRPAR